MEIPKPNEVLPFPNRESVIAQTRGGLETLASLLAPAATIGLMIYGFSLMFRGVMRSSSPTRLIG